MEKDLCVKGWNWGTMKFGGQLLSFDTGHQPVFKIPLSNVSQCTTGKNEVTLEFHQNDGAEASLMGVRVYMPRTQQDGVDPAEASPRTCYRGRTRFRPLETPCAPSGSCSV